MTLWVIKETKRYGRTDGRTDGRTHGQRENSIPPTNKVCGGYNYHPDSFMQMFNVSTLHRQSIKLLHQKLWWELISPWRHHLCIYKHLIRENCLSSHYCHFVKKKSEPNSFMHIFNVSTLYRQSIKLLHQKLLWELISPWGTIYAYTKALLGKIVYVLTAVILSKIIFFSPRLLLTYFQGV